MVMQFLVWRLGYMLFTAQRGKMTATRFTDHWFYIWPPWGGSSTPYGKGLDYLASCEAKDPTWGESPSCGHGVRARGHVWFERNH